MKKFKYVNALGVNDAISILSEFGKDARILAGGTDLLGQMKNRIFPYYPNVLINIKSIPKLDHIIEDEKHLRIGALAKLRDIESHPAIKEKYTALAQAARAVASLQIRAMGTIGGNICQDNRCWYYRAPKNYFPCLRKPGVEKGAICYAVKGDNRYHSILGPIKRCFAVNPGDTAPALIALNAKFITTSRIIHSEDFFAAMPGKTTILADNEILTEIQIPKPGNTFKSGFLKFSLRKAIDFPVVNCAAFVACKSGVVQEARICLNAVYNNPYKAERAENFLKGKTISYSVAEAAGKKTFEKTIPLSRNKYMIKIAQELTKKVIISCQ